MQASFDTNKGRQTGEVIKANKKTILVKFRYKENIAKKGAKAIFKVYEKTIKRHKKKHNVVIEGE